MEIFKDIPEYEGMYQVSNLGRVKSLKFNREKILKPTVGSHGYLLVMLCNEGKQKTRQIHQLVVMTFLNHIPCGHKIVVDHKNNDKQDNRLENLQLISARYNTSKDKKGFTSKYTGVSWSKAANKWRSKIEISGKLKHLGIFNSEEEASKYYQDALKSIEEGTEIKVKKPKTSSKYKGVSWNKNRNKWVSTITINGKQKNLGYFNCELAASVEYQKKLAEISK